MTLIFFFFLVKRYDILKHKRDYKLAIEAKVVAICLKQYSSLTSDTRSLSNSSEGEDSKITKSSLRQQPFLVKKSAHWFIFLYICVTRTSVAFAMRNLQSESREEHFKLVLFELSALFSISTIILASNSTSKHRIPSWVASFKPSLKAQSSAITLVASLNDPN